MNDIQKALFQKRMSESNSSTLNVVFLRLNPDGSHDCVTYGPVNGLIILQGVLSYYVAKSMKKFWKKESEEEEAPKNA